MQYEIFLERMHMNPNCIIAMTRFISDKPISSSEKGNCLFMHLKRVFEGGVLEVMSDTIPCPGFGVNTGLVSGFPKIPGGFENFLSHGCNEQGCPPGERIKKNPELATKFFEAMPKDTMEGYNAIRLEQFTPGIVADLVICFATADQLAGLTYLQNYDIAGYDSVMVATVSGCASITKIALGEIKKSEPRAVIGSLDSASRIFHDKELISFTVPAKIFEKMISYPSECFFDTPFWRALEKRMLSN